MALMSAKGYEYLCSRFTPGLCGRPCRVVEEGFSIPSDYVRTLIREDRRRRDFLRERRAGLEALQRAVLQGIEDADTGRTHELDDVVSTVKRRGRSRLAKTTS